MKSYKALFIIILIVIALLNIAWTEDNSIRTFEGHSDNVNSVSFSPDGKYVISGAGQTIGPIVWGISNSTGTVKQIRGDVTSWDNTLKLWDISTGKEIKTFKGHSEAVNSVAFSPDGKYIISGSMDNTLKLWDIEKGKKIKTFKGHSEPVNSVSFSPDGKYVISGSSDNTIKLWDIKKGKKIKTFKGHSGDVLSVSFSPDSKYVISGSADKTLKLWDIEKSKEIKTFKAHSEAVTSVSFSPEDGQHIISGSKDNTLKLWDISTGTVIKTFYGHSSSIWSVSFSPDGKYVISGDDDRTLKLWDIEKSKEIKTFKGHSRYVNSVSFSPDGKYVISGSSDNTIKLWDSGFVTVTSTTTTRPSLPMNGKENEKRENPVAIPTRPSLPPLLTAKADFQDLLIGGETAKLKITLTNNGPGEALNLIVNIKNNYATTYLKFKNKIIIDKIKANGGSEIIEVIISVDELAPTQEAELLISFEEPYFHVEPVPIKVPFTIQKMKEPKLVLNQIVLSDEIQGISQGNNVIDRGEMFNVLMIIQNTGRGNAENVHISVNNNQTGIMSLGLDIQGGLEQKEDYEIGQLKAGEYKQIAFRYLINNQFNANNITFNISINEKRKRFSISEKRSFEIDVAQPQIDIANIQKIERTSETAIITSPIPDLEVDVDINIPKGKLPNHNAIAIVIGNRNYKNKDVPMVDYAHNDANIMKQYLIKSMGFREGNIMFVLDATQADFNSIFGTKDNHKGKLFNWVKEDESDVFIYYSGHGAPNPENKKGYFVPVDCDPSLVSLNGYLLDTFYNNLNKIPYKSLTVIIDACFSGSSSAGMLLHDMSPVFISVENPLSLNQENSSVFSSATGEQVSSWYPEKQHSLFTYYFLKGLQGDADINNNGEITTGELEIYINDNVPYKARRLNNREQTPLFNGNKEKILVKY